MLNAVIQLSLKNRLAIICFAIAVIVLGSLVLQSLPIDVLPKLTRPRVVLVTECEGLAPEEVEQRVTFPLEAAINGASGVIAVRPQIIFPGATTHFPIKADGSGNRPLQLCGGACT